MTTANIAATLRTVTVSTKYGDKSIESALTVKDALYVLATAANPSNFALDLIANNRKYGLSPKQANWVVYLAQETLDKQNKPVAPVAVLADVKPIFALFANAHLSLKFPRLRLQDANGRLVVIKLSGSGSKHCGSLNLTNGAKFGDDDNVFFGYIHQDGSCTVKDQAVLDLLKALAADPAGVAASQGLASGQCVFCAKSLSDSENGSSEIGYGRTCAGHWNLPWTRNGVATPVVKAKKARKAAPITKLKNTAKIKVDQATLDSANAYLASLND